MGNIQSDGKRVTSQHIFNEQKRPPSIHLYKHGSKLVSIDSPTSCAVSGKVSSLNGVNSTSSSPENVRICAFSVSDSSMGTAFHVPTGVQASLNGKKGRNSLLSLTRVISGLGKKRISSSGTRKFHEQAMQTTERPLTSSSSHSLPLRHQQSALSSSDHIMARPHTLVINGVSATEDWMPDASDCVFTPNDNQLACSPLPDDSKIVAMADDDLNNSQSSTKAYGNSKNLRSFPGRRRCISATTSQICRRPRFDGRAATLLENPPVVTPISCNLVQHRSSEVQHESLPFPNGSAYMMSDEQHRNVEQNLHSTKLMLYKLKRLLNENVGHLPSIEDQQESQRVAPLQLTENITARSQFISKISDVPKTEPNLNGLPQPNNFKEALLEIQRLRLENIRLQNEIAKMNESSRTNAN